MRRSGRGRGRALRASSGGQLLVLGILLAVFALWVAPGLSSGSHGAGAGREASSGARDGAAGPGEPGEIGEAVSSPPPDPVGDAYRTVRPGDCLAAPDGDAPRRVDCADEAAFQRVDAVVPQVANCPRGPGLSTWYHTTADGLTTALCLRREFRPGQCFAARLSTEDGRYEMTDADLRSRLGCADDEAPPPYNVVLVISEVLPTVPHDLDCARGPDGRGDYWYWIANDADVKVCATFADG